MIPALSRRLAPSLARLAFAAALAAPLPAAYAQPATDPNPPSAAQSSSPLDAENARETAYLGPVINLDFSGGTLAELITALRALPTDAPINIVANTSLLSTPIPPLKFVGVRLSAVLEAAVQSSDPSIVIRFNSAQGTSLSPAISIVSNQVSATRTKVFPLARINVEPQSPQAAIALASLEAALETIPGPAPLLTFHEPSGLIIIRGSDEQLSLADDVFNRLGDSFPSRAASAQTTLTFVPKHIDSTNLFQLFSTSLGKLLRGDPKPELRQSSSNSLTLTVPDHIAAFLNDLFPYLDRDPLASSAAQALQQRAATAERSALDLERQLAAASDQLARSEAAQSALRSALTQSESRQQDLIARYEQRLAELRSRLDLLHSAPSPAPSPSTPANPNEPR